MFDQSAKFQKLNSLALENGHLENSAGKPKYLFSTAEDQTKLNPENTRSIPAIAFSKNETLNALFFNSGGVENPILN